MSAAAAAARELAAAAEPELSERLGAPLDPVQRARIEQVMGHAKSRAKLLTELAEAGWWAETPRPHFADAARAQDLAGALGLEPEALDRPIAQLSTGERQRLALVRSILDHPAILLLDEPTGALDADTAACAEELIRAEMATGSAVVLVSHDAAQAARLAGQRLVLGQGEARLEEV